jgi:alpha 1,3-glucosidase
MKHDPFTLRVALDTSGNARGEVYLDDGETYGYGRGDVVWRGFDAESTKGKGKGKEIRTVRISSVDLATRTAVGVYDPKNEFARSVGDVRVEKLVVLGLGKKPLSVVLDGGRELEWEFALEGGVLVVKDPAVRVVDDWAVIVKLE